VRSGEGWSPSKRVMLHYTCFQCSGWLIECYNIDALLLAGTYRTILGRLLRLHARIFDNLTTLIIAEGDRSICPSQQKVELKIEFEKEDITVVFMSI